MPYYEDIVHLCDIPRYHAKHNPDEIAFIYEDKQTTYDNKLCHMRHFAG